MIPLNARGGGDVLQNENETHFTFKVEMTLN
jgi:hypothetical protein